MHKRILSIGFGAQLVGIVKREFGAMFASELAELRSAAAASRRVPTFDFSSKCAAVCRGAVVS